jgi:beta-lactamase regulating signal transducer with metallopeptidase domain
MIAAYALYAMVWSVLIGVMAVLAERGALLLRRSVRWVWLTAIVAMVALPALLLLAGHGRAEMSEVMDAAPMAMTSEVSDATAISAWDSVRVASVPAPVSLAMRWERLLVGIAERTEHADATLLAMWALLSTGLALCVWRASRRGQQLPRSLSSRTVQGTAVFVSEAIGPAAIGGASPSIVIPEWVLQLDAGLVSLVLAHEREHLRAHDPRVLSAGLAFVVLVPWHAPLWWAWRRLRLAIELDCDARVLRAANSPRLYATLLLFMSQQRVAPRRWHFGDALALPLLLAFNPHAQHLKRRINAMTMRPSRRPVRFLLIASASLTTAKLAAAIPTPTILTSALSVPTGQAAPVRVSRRADSVLVKVTRLGIELAQAPATGSPPLEIVMYGDGPVRVGLGTAALTPLRDTIRLDHLPAFTADVSYGDVHVEMRRVAGKLTLGGDVTGGVISGFSLRGRHVVLSSRAMGIGAAASPVAPARSQWDSLTARKAALELERVRLLVTYEPRFARVQSVDRELGRLDDQLRSMPSVVAWNVIRSTTQALGARAETLLGERERLDARAKRASREFAAIEVERGLLRERMTALRRLQAQWGPLPKPYSVRTPVSEAQSVTVDSVRAAAVVGVSAASPRSLRDSIDQRLSALGRALTNLGAPEASQATIASVQAMNQAGMPDSTRAALRQRLDALQPMLLVDSIQRLRRRMDSTMRATGSLSRDR